jgi:diacylglycerol kinase (ATP)
MSVVVIANPAAGRGRAVAAARAAAALIEAQGEAVTLQETRAPGHARELAGDAVKNGAACVLAVGGDGTLNEVASGLAHSACAMAVLAAGRGNDFAGALGLPHDPAAAAAAVLSGFSTATDLGLINGRVFLTVAATGFDAAVARRVHDGGFRIFGSLAYLAGALWMLPTWPAPRLRLRGDFGEREGPYLLAAAGNTTRYGGGVHMTPGASPHDGMLECCLVRDLSRLRALALLPQTYSGSHGRYAEVEMVPTRRLEIEAAGQVFMTADGELMGESRAVIEVAPGALLIQGRAR